MRDIKFRVWHTPESKMYYRGYQKIFSILICEDDHGTNAGRGIPVKCARFDDCEMLEGTGVFDEAGREIFEGDIVKIQCEGRTFLGSVDAVPDMFRSRGLHPLKSLLEKYGLADKQEVLQFVVMGNVFENSEVLKKAGSEA